MMIRVLVRPIGKIPNVLVRTIVNDSNAFSIESIPHGITPMEKILATLEFFWNAGKQWLR